MTEQRRLTLLRHAKSDWSQALDDHDRPLNPRGRKAAPLIGRWLQQQGLLPDLVICSSARRARETFELMAAGFTPPLPVRYDDRLYLAAPATIGQLASMAGRETGAAHIMLVGHNPGMHDYALTLAATGQPTTDQPAAPDGQALQTKFPTAALASFVLPVTDWHAWDGHSAVLTYFITPKKLPASHRPRTRWSDY